ncbi:DUF4359 domain-containing protein [Nitrospira sp. Kam-Ns4a]
MSTAGLASLVVVLAVCVGLAASNPTMDEYDQFVLAQLEAVLSRSGSRAQPRERALVAHLFAFQSRQIMDSLIRPNSRQWNYGLFSLFETRLLDQRVLVLGIGHQFLPLAGVEEAARTLGSLAPALSR